MTKAQRPRSQEAEIKKIATIDIGTHSVLLLIAERVGGKVRSWVDQATLTRIGEGLGKNDVFLPESMERTLEVLKKYKKICDDQCVTNILCVGTAAFRKAKNASDFVKQVEKECGITTQIISGEREATLTWKAASTDFGENIMVVDIGGGSTEIIRHDSRKVHAVSMPIGSVVLTEKYCHSDPISETDYQKICAAIEEQLSSFDTSILRHSETLIATAGTVTTLGAIKLGMKVYKHNEVHGTKLLQAELRAIIADFKSKTIEERKKIPGLEPGRADVILSGSLILEKVAGHFGFKEITVSDRGVRWGLIYNNLTP